MFAQTEVRAWIQASRLPSQMYTLLPLLLGQVLACVHNASFFSYKILLLSLVYSLSLQLFIVYANDLADYETDSLNDHWTIFSGGSRVLVDKLLQNKDLEIGACLSLAMVLTLGFFFSYYRSNFLILFLACSGPLMLWMYSYSPFKLSYRGGGELLQAFGLAVILPSMGFLIQGGEQLYTLFPLFLALFLTQVACAMSTTIPDATSDSFSNKRTFIVFLGPYKSCFLIFLCHTLSYFTVLFLLFQGYLLQGKGLLFALSLQILLSSFMLYSFFKRKLESFIFFSLSLTFGLLLFIMTLAISLIFNQV